MKNTPILLPEAFPLRVDREPGDDYPGWAVWTRLDNRLGTMNNFVLCEGIQHKELAEWICQTLNDAAGYGKPDFLSQALNEGDGVYRP